MECGEVTIVTILLSESRMVIATMSHGSNICLYMIYVHLALHLTNNFPISSFPLLFPFIFEVSFELIN